MSLTPHPVAEIFPAWSEEALAALVADVRAQGLLEPIVTLDGQVLDGRHRLAACAAAGVEPRFVEFDGADPLAFVIAKNLHRRHLNESQRSMVAARMANMRQGARTDLAQICAKSQDEAADQLNVSRRTVQHAAKILDLGLPELTHIVEQGQMPVSTAAAVAELPDAEQEKIVSIADAKARRTAARKILLKPCPERRRRDQPKGRAKPRKINIVTGHPLPSDEDLAIYDPLLEILAACHRLLADRNPEWLAREFIRRFPWGFANRVDDLYTHFPSAFELMAALHTELQKQKKTRR